MSSNAKYNQENTVIPCVRISGQGITLYNEYPDKTYVSRDRSSSNANMANIVDPWAHIPDAVPLPSLAAPETVVSSKIQKKSIQNRPEILSKKSIASIKNALYTMLWLTDCKQVINNTVVTIPRKKLSFATLTLSSAQRHSDIFLKNTMLNQLLVELRQEHDDLLYIWRSEKQYNGNCHFHIILNKFIHSAKLRKQWNRIQNKHGYVEEYRQKFNNMSFEEYISYMAIYPNISAAALIKYYKQGQDTGWTNPNSTDINYLKKVNDVQAYISKELTKQNQMIEGETPAAPWPFPLSGKNFSCSQKLSDKSAISDHVSETIYSDLQKLQHIAQRYQWKNDHITHYSISPDLFLQFGLKNLHLYYQNFLQS